MKVYIIPHIVKRPIEKLLAEEFGEEEYKVVYADDKMYYRYWDEGWSNSLGERAEKKIKENTKEADEILFITVGFQPAVIKVWDVVKNIFGEVSILTYDSEAEKFIEVR